MLEIINNMSPNIAGCNCPTYGLPRCNADSVPKCSTGKILRSCHFAGTWRCKNGTVPLIAMILMLFFSCN